MLPVAKAVWRSGVVLSILYRRFTMLMSEVSGERSEVAVDHLLVYFLVYSSTCESTQFLQETVAAYSTLDRERVIDAPAPHARPEAAKGEAYPHDRLLRVHQHTLNSKVPLPRGSIRSVKYNTHAYRIL